MEIKSHGLNLELELQSRTPSDWVFGSVAAPSLFQIPEAQRQVYLPNGELQNIGEEKYFCATAGPLNVIEAKLNYAYVNNLFKAETKKWLEDNGYVNGGKIELSDSFNAIKSGTTRGGNSMKAPLVSIENDGIVPKSLLPQLNTFDENYALQRITPELIALGLEFRKRLPINYCLIPIQDLTVALLQDFAVLAGYAWPSPVNGEYPASDNQPNHVFIGFNVPKTFIFDNYFDEGVAGDFIKKLAPNYNFLDSKYQVFISGDNVPEKKSPNPNCLQNLIQRLW